MVLLYTASVMVGVTLAAVILLGLLDYWLRFDDPGLRIIALLALVGAVAWAACRCAKVAAAARIPDVRLAAWVQKHFPQLEDRLASAVEFLRQGEDDPLAGSAALRRAVIEQTAAQAAAVPFDRILDHRWTLRVAVRTALVVLLAAILVVADPSSAGIAVARLVHPLSPVSWPQRTHLVLRRHMPQVALGQSFEVEVAAAEGTQLPAEVRIYYRFRSPDGAYTIQSEPMRRIGEVMVARRDNVTSDFAYRVEGGDDRSMDWLEVQVIPPPSLLSLSIELTPPEYTGWRSGPADKSIRALVGTKARFVGRADKPLQAAALCLEDGRKLRAWLGEDKQDFLVPGPSDQPLVIDKSTAYWFELTDRDGLSSGAETRWQIQAVADQPPIASIEQPKGAIFATPQAVVPVIVAASDDLALRRVELHCARSDRPQSPEALLLYQGPEQVVTGHPPAPPAAAQESDRRNFKYRIALDQFGLPPGSHVDLYAVAVDYLGQSSSSQPRRVSIVTVEQMHKRLGLRQAAVVAELERALKMQRANQSQIGALHVRLTAQKRLEQADVDNLQAAELNQRQINRTLAGRGEGVPELVLGLLAELDNNRIDNAEMRRQMENVLLQIDRLERQHLIELGRQLTAAVKAAQLRMQGASAPVQPDESLLRPLTEATVHQQQVIAALEELLGRLARWDGYRRFQRELGQLLEQQQQLAARGTQLAQQTLTRPLPELTPQESAGLNALATEQLGLAQQLDRTLQQMHSEAAQLHSADPLSAQSIADACAEAQRLAIAAHMRSCAESFRENRMGQAMAAQKQIIEGLQELLDILSGRRDQELVRLMGKLEQSQAELAGLLERQQTIRQQFASASLLPPGAAQRKELQSLGSTEDALRSQAEQLARRLERLEAQRPAAEVGQAAQQMLRASKAAAAGDAAQGLAGATAALRHLEAAQAELAARRLQMHAEMLQQQLARLDETVKQLHAEQQDLLEQTRQLHAARGSPHQLTRTEAAALAALADRQRQLRSHAVDLAGQMAAAPALRFVLEGAAESMNQASQLLEQRQSGADTQNAQRAALAQLALLIEAVRPEPDDDQPSQQAEMPGDVEQNPAGAVRSVAELKIIRLMQQQINTQTQQLHRQTSAGGPAIAERKDAFGALAGQQGRLAELLLRLIGAMQQKAERSPEAESSLKSESPLKSESSQTVSPPGGEPSAESRSAELEEFRTKLIRQLGQAAESEQDNPLLDIAQRMHITAKRIAQLDAGEQTQRTQAGILADLDELIRQSRQASRQAGPSRMQQIAARFSANGTTPRDDAGASGEKSTAQTMQPPESTQPKPEDLEKAIEAMKRNIWGMLPQHQRDAVMELPVEEFLPQYRTAIESYFRRLAEGAK